jgi:hypothetical protein
LGSQVDLWAEVLEHYSSSDDSVGSVLKKFRAQTEGRIGSNINSDSDRHYWGKNRCVAIGRLFNKQLIKREISFIKEVITKEESIAPKANLSALYIDTNLPLVGA